MQRTRTFGSKLAAAFATVVALTVLASAVAVYSLRRVVGEKDHVITSIGKNLHEAKDLWISIEQRVAEVRGYLLTGDEKFVGEVFQERQQSSELLTRLKENAQQAAQKQRIEEIDRANESHVTAVSRVLELKNEEADPASIQRYFDQEVVKRFETLRALIVDFVKEEKRLGEALRQQASRTATRAGIFVVAVASLTVLFSIVLGILLIRSLNRQIGSTVQHMQSSSAELHTAANQQATSSNQQVSAIQETQATMKELLAAARQIGESARHVAGVAQEARQATGRGEEVVRKGRDSIGVVKDQVDLVVNQMLDLGGKSKQIGGVVEIINELSEQTNILAVNATIEAAGAGESGARFASVAEEIRSLADRVGSSTREIRTMVEEIRSAVNSTVMATESSSKAVEAGAKQFDGVTTSFTEISTIVENTAEAAREIELSTNQQTSAIEQINTAVVDVSQAAQQSDSSARQTLETATRLNRLSGELFSLIRSTNGV